MEDHKECLLCQAKDNETILVNMSYKGNSIWMCPVHLPVLIHSPQKLVGVIEGAEGFKAGWLI